MIRKSALFTCDKLMDKHGRALVIRPPLMVGREEDDRLEDPQVRGTKTSA